MTTIHTFHTTIQFPTSPDDDLLPSLSSFPFLWPDLRPQRETWTTVDGRDPLLHSVLDYATDAIDEEHAYRRHYQHACSFHGAGNSFLAARWMNLTIERVIATVHRWMDVAGMLVMVERDAPELTPIVHPLLEQVGSQQQRLFTLLAILQGVSFTYCQTHHMMPTLFSSLEGEENTMLPLSRIENAYHQQQEEVQP